MIERHIRYVFLAMLTALLMSCGGTGGGGGDDDDGDNDPDQPTGGTGEISQLTAGSGADQVQVDSSVLVFADISDTDGNAVSGQDVTFSTSAGSLSDTTDETNGNGRASVTLTAPQNLGNAVVSMSAGGFSDSVTIEITPGAPSNVSISAAPVTAALNRTVDISVSVTDSFGNPVPNETVQFSANPNNSGGEFSNLLQTTDANGRVSGEYVTGSSAGNDTLQATVGSVSDTVTVTADPDAAALGSLNLTALSTEIVADGTSQALIRAEVSDTSGTEIQGIEVNFTTSAGTLSSGTVTTDASGRAEVQLTSETRVTTAQVNASVGGLNQATEVDFLAGAPVVTNSTISANPTSLAADGTSTTNIVVTLADANNNPVSGETVTLQKTGDGTITSTNPTTTTLGRAEFEINHPAASRGVFQNSPS